MNGAGKAWKSVSARAHVLKAFLAQRLTTDYAFSALRNLHDHHEIGTRRIIPCAQALFDAETLNRVQACAFGRTREDELGTLTATSFVETPCQVFHFGPSLVAGGQIYTPQGDLFFGRRAPMRAALGTLQQFKTLNMISSYQGLKYFGHWLRDDCPVYELLRAQGEVGHFLKRPNWSDRTLYEPAFKQGDEDVDFAYVEALTLYREQGFNLDKAQRIRVLRDQLRQRHPPRKSGHIVYLSRSPEPNPRDMSNRADFEQALAASGIQIVHPNSDPHEMVQELLDAAMIITIEGSQAAHGAYMLQEGGAMLILQTPHRFYNPHHEWARLMGMRYGTVIGTATHDGYTMNSDEVLRMVERLNP